MSENNQIPTVYASLFSNNDFIETVKGLSLCLAHENEGFREDLKTALFPDIEETIEKKIKESYKSPDFEAALDSGLSTLDIFRNIPRRIKELEVAVGIKECDPDEIDEYAVPMRIQKLEDKLNGVNIGATEILTTAIKQKTKTGNRAVQLITRLKASGKKHLTHKEIKSILTEQIPEDYRIDLKAGNPRKMIIDVLKEAETICADVFLDQKKNGHKEWRMVLKS